MKEESLIWKILALNASVLAIGAFFFSDEIGVLHIPTLFAVSFIIAALCAPLVLFEAVAWMAISAVLKPAIGFLGRLSERRAFKARYGKPALSKTEKRARVKEYLRRNAAATPAIS
jgi:hypothetical protein